MRQPSAAEVAARRADVQSPGDAIGRHDRIRLPTPATGRYVRMLGVERRSFHNPAPAPATARFGHSLYEFQVWGTGGSASAARPALPADQDGSHRTVFQDDFDGTALDRGKGRVVKTGGTVGVVNGESRAYVDSPDAIAVGGGTLKLRARHRKGCAACGWRSTGSRSSRRADGRDRPYPPRAARRPPPSRTGRPAAPAPQPSSAAMTTSTGTDAMVDSRMDSRARFSAIR
ncbi:hypothetical protein GCM10010405_12950 [Streptomyces macrosporus]|uniref:Uncharacterized protein n=1 Tax=Streptomyces macrosporus TaxID=44032 RepID=A0ABP5WRA2_9ACTN